jgi:hypothetical protein
MGGSIDDDVGCYLVERFVDNYLSSPKNFKPFGKKEKNIIEFIKLIQPDDPKTRMCDGKFLIGTELELILKESIRITMPNIWVNKNRPIIAGALIFLEPFETKFGLQMMYILMPEFGSHGRNRFLKEWAKSSTYQILNRYKKHRFDYEIKINSQGNGLTMDSALWEGHSPTFIPFLIFFIILTIITVVIKSK